ncbi:hypothetical protein J6590_072529 [Homalodisca vitripennis]|nr:hypothetical protein J6590_072529 [Homalodisca vitripennis]
MMEKRAENLLLIIPKATVRRRAEGRISAITQPEPKRNHRNGAIMRFNRQLPDSQTTNVINKSVTNGKRKSGV